MSNYEKLREYLRDNFQINYVCEHYTYNQDLFGRFLNSITNNTSDSICVESNKLGRCYYKYTYLNLNDAPLRLGNHDNKEIIFEKVIGKNKFVMYSTKVDSGD